MLSINKTPFKWSISWAKACASKSFPTIFTFFPSSFKASTTTSFGLIIFAYSFGKLKHPSSTSCSPLVLIILGFTSFNGSSPSYKSITITLLSTPTCGPASPTPLYLCMVSTISSNNSFILSSTVSTSLEVFLRISSFDNLISLIAILFAPFSHYKY